MWKLLLMALHYLHTQSLLLQTIQMKLLYTLAFQALDSDLPPSQPYSVVIEAENRPVEPIQLDRVKWAHAYRVIIVPFA